MICPACGNEFADKMPVCPYCQTHLPEKITKGGADSSYIKSFYSADTIQLRKEHQISNLVALLLVIALAVLAVFFQLQKPSLPVQLRRADAAGIAEICTEYAAETADDQYTQTLLDAIADLQQTYVLYNDQEDEVIANLQKIATTQNVMAREQACSVIADMESDRLLQEINRVRTQRQKRMLTEEDTLKETAQLLAATYQENPDGYEEEAARIVKENIADAENVYHIMMMNCNSYADAVSQYNGEEKEATVNFLTTQDYTTVGTASVYDPTTQQFAFILLLAP
jgi:hypothetical protein